MIRNIANELRTFVDSCEETHKDYLKEIAGLESGEKGVRMTKEKGMLIFDLYVKVRYGENIPVLAWNIQHLVTEALKEKTDDKIKEVNIHVQGVDLE